MPTVSAVQRRAMHAAAKGKLGIPRKAAKEFIKEDKKKRPKTILEG